MGVEKKKICNKSENDFLAGWLELNFFAPAVYLATVPHREPCQRPHFTSSNEF